MACPYFMPETKIENGNWPHPARLPLGCGWNGHCTAPGHEQQLPPQAVLEGSCNLGYASRCEWVPAERIWDAARFAVNAPAGTTAQEKSPTNDGPVRILSLSFVCERHHRPVEHGQLQFDLRQSAWIHPHPDARIQRMAECFLDAYLKKNARVGA